MIFVQYFLLLGHKICVGFSTVEINNIEFRVFVILVLSYFVSIQYQPYLPFFNPNKMWITICSFYSDCLAALSHETKQNYIRLF